MVIDTASLSKLVQLHEIFYDALSLFYGSGHLNFIQLLIDNGANVNLADAYGETALHTSVVNGKWKKVS